jgi:IS30 family transposase
MNENTNGLIRRHFPKGTDFNKFSEAEILAVQNIINNLAAEQRGIFSATLSK